MAIFIIFDTGTVEFDTTGTVVVVLTGTGTCTVLGMISGATDAFSTPDVDDTPDTGTVNTGFGG